METQAGLNPARVGSIPTARTNARVAQPVGGTCPRRTAVRVRIPARVPISAGGQTVKSPRSDRGVLRVRLPLCAPLRMVNRSGLRHRLESGWHRKVFASAATPSSITDDDAMARELALKTSGAETLGDRYLRHPPIWKVNRSGEWARLESGAALARWGSRPRPSARMDSQLGECRAPVRSGMDAARHWRSGLRLSAKLDAR